MVARGSTVEWQAYRAVLLDLDGVITPTASVHEVAWAELFSPWGFTSEDYLTYVDGKPRYDGVRSFLTSRGVELPAGTPEDPPGDGTVAAMGNRKDELFRELLARDGVAPYPGRWRCWTSSTAWVSRRRWCRRRAMRARSSRPPVWATGSSTWWTA